MRFLFLGVVITLASTSLAVAQESLNDRNVILTKENPHLRARLEALDRHLSLLASATDVGKFVAWSAPGFILRPFVALLLESSAQDKWEEALADYQKLIDEAGDSLVPASSGQRAGHASLVDFPSVEARLLVHRRIARLPASLLARYRQGVDAQAQQLLKQGKDERSPEPLRRLVEEFFCSRPAGETLDLLGDLCFEQGNFEEALAWWRLVVTSPGEAHFQVADRLMVPDPVIDSTRIRAKQVLAYAFMNQLDRARADLEAFRQLHPNASGSLAGRNGPYAALLETWIERLSARLGPDNQLPWSTYAGNPARNRVLAVSPSPRLWAEGPAWRLPLAAPEGADRKTRESLAQRLAFHPVIAEDQVLLADALSVTSYDLFTGKKHFHFDLDPKNAATGRRRSSPQASRFTLTASNKSVFASLGSQRLLPKASQSKGDMENCLVCLNLFGAQPGSLLWRVAAKVPDGSPAFFEGAPVLAENRVYIAMSWLVGQRVHSALACFDAQTGRRNWWQEVCVAAEVEDYSEPVERQHLLTMGGGKLFYCSHSGAIVALDPWSGRCHWGTRYGSWAAGNENGPLSPRELAPCIYADGKLYSAPRDDRAVHCLDAASGRLLWKRDSIEVVHLLGVTRGRIYLTSARGLHCWNADTGEHGLVGRQSTNKADHQQGWMQPAEGKLAGLGRGLLAGSWLFWPTQDPYLPVRGVTLAEGYQQRFAIDNKAPAEPEYLEPTMLRLILQGNMSFGQGCLAVAGLEELAVYVPVNARK